MVSGPTAALGNSPRTAASPAARAQAAREAEQLAGPEVITVRLGVVQGHVPPEALPPDTDAQIARLAALRAAGHFARLTALRTDAPGLRAYLDELPWDAAAIRAGSDRDRVAAITAALCRFALETLERPTSGAAQGSPA